MRRKLAKPITLKGSCQCGAVRFSVRSRQYYPYQRCYCSICRKTQGGGGYAINLSAEAKTLKITGRKHIRMYHPVMREKSKRPRRSGGERHFCGECGTSLWVFDREWPELIHPYASAIDTELPTPPDSTHLMLNYKPKWVEPQIKPRDKTFEEYPEETIAEWHARHGFIKEPH